MTGSLRWCEASEPAHPHDRVVFDFDDGQLRYQDLRKLQGIRVLHGDGEVCGALHGLAPDAATIDLEGSAKSCIATDALTAGPPGT
jgi:formamidopyrimidine-DNA glycosylase